MKKSIKYVSTHFFCSMLALILCLGLLNSRVPIVNAQSISPDNHDIETFNADLFPTSTLSIVASISRDQIQGDGMLPDSPITLTIDGLEIATETSSPSGTVTFFMPGLFDVKSGQVVVLNDGITKIKHKVKNISVTKFYLDSDTVLGTGDPYGSVQVTGYRSDGGLGYSLTVKADSIGNWKAKLTGPQYAPYDLEENCIVVVSQKDAKGNRTMLDTFVLTAPNLQVPSIEGTSVSLSWEKTSIRGFFPVKYKVQVAKDPAFARLVINQKVTGLTLDVANLKPSKTYYWRVRQLQEAGPKSPWSVVENFTIPIP